MKRIQVYVEDEVMKVLRVRARQSRRTISDLVREAVREKYLTSAVERKDALLAAVGLWKNRPDLPNTQTYFRNLRKGRRIDRLFR